MNFIGVLLNAINNMTGERDIRNIFLSWDECRIVGNLILQEFYFRESLITNSQFLPLTKFIILQDTNYEISRSLNLVKTVFFLLCVLLVRLNSSCAIQVSH